MAVRLVPLKDLKLTHPLWVNPRSKTGLDKESIAALAADIKVRGIIDRPTVQRIQDGNGWVELVLDGQRRILALRESGAPGDGEIEVVDHLDGVIALDQKAANELLINIMAKGHFREGLSSFEQVENADRLREAGATVVAIGKAIGRDASWVSRMLAAKAAAAPALLASWKSDEITTEQFKDLAGAVERGDQPKVVAKIIELRQSDDPLAKSGAREIVKELAQRKRTEIDDAKAAKLAEKTAKTEAAAKEREEARAAKERAKLEAKAKKEGKTLPPPPKKEKAAPAAKPTKPAKPSVASRAMLEELVALGNKRAVIGDYMLGLMDGAKYALGILDPSKFRKPWKVFLQKIDGTSFSNVPAKPATKKVTKVAKAPKAKATKKSR